MALIQIAGSLGIFLFGMNLMGNGLKKYSGTTLQSILQRLTQNRFTAVITGFLATVLVQSSSATTVIIVGFVHGGLMNLTQAIGVIMGANIGTTVTGWIVAILGFRFQIVEFAFFTMMVGTLLTMVPKIRRPITGEILIGFSLLFIGLDFLRRSVPDIRSNPEILEFVQNLTGFGYGSVFIFILFGTLLTILVQSSSAAMAITLTLAFSGWIDFTSSAAIILGENIGTTITAYVASLGQNVHSRRAARAHTLFNLFGVSWMLLVFYPFLNLTTLIIPGADLDPAVLTSRLALYHSLFNVTNTFICIWFLPQFSRLVERIVKPRQSDLVQDYKLSYIDTGLPNSVAMNLDRGIKELKILSSLVTEVFSTCTQEFLEMTKTAKVTKDGKKKSPQPVLLSYRLKETFDQIRIMYLQLSQFFITCTHHTNGAEDANRASSALQSLQELDNTTASLDKIVKIIDKFQQDPIPLGKKEYAQIYGYFNLIGVFMEYAYGQIGSYISADQFERAQDLEKKIDKLRSRLRKRSRKRMQDESTNVRQELMYMDVVRHAEHLGDFTYRIAEGLLNPQEEG
jgi:phosphate:Na+ symporter